MDNLDKTKAAAGRQSANARTRRKLPTPSIWQRIPTGAYIFVVGLVVLGLGIGLPVYFSQRHHMGGASRPEGGGASISQSVAAGQPAPGFTLKDTNGQSYTLSPGDGKAHLLVFYMGYF